MDASKQMIETEGGGKRELLEESWHLLPYAALSWMAKVLYYGAFKYAPNNWQNLDFDHISACPGNHGLRHLSKAMCMPRGAQGRAWQLAKAGVNVMFELWKEQQILDEQEKGSER